MNTIPKHVEEIISNLKKASFEAFAVGGCVRDLILGNEPKDWDVATSARPKDIMKIFPDSVYENEFGTVGVKVKSQKGEIETEIVEVTTYRIESKYSDKRHPDGVKFAETLEEDLSRRDFTINALAAKLATSKKYEVIDLFGGRADLKNKIIRAVGDANKRFNEDALRMIRAIRFSVQFSFSLDKKTFSAIKKNSKNLNHVSRERIRDEFIKIILSSSPAEGVELLREAGLLRFIIPEIETGYDVTQSRHHYYGPYNTVYKHLLASLKKCPSKKLEVRLASLLHDIGKPDTKSGRGENATFYGHEYISAKITQKILEKLKFSRNIIEKTVLLVKNHMFYYNVAEVGEAGVRRIIRKVGLENIADLIDVRVADRLGSGVPKAIPYKLRHFKFMVEKVSHDALSVKQLKLNGHDLIKELGLVSGPKIGAILEVLLAQVIDQPELNKKSKLLKTAKELSGKDISFLKKIAKEKIAEGKKEEERLMKKKYWVE